MSIKYFLFWLPMIILAFGNAAFRQMVLIRYLNDLRAHQLSTITLILLCTVYVAFVFPWLNVQSYQQSVVAGLIWVVLTILFEFSLGRLTGRSWSDLLQDYNLGAGRIWPLFLLCLFLLPYLFYHFRK